MMIAKEYVWEFRIKTAAGGLVGTSARGKDPENAKCNLWKRYPNAVILEMRLRD